MTISLFSGRYAFLSNFYPSQIAFEGQFYPTVEHAFQAAKTLDFAERERISSLGTPGLAKKAGRKLNLRPGWNDKRIEVMWHLLQLKFEIPFLRNELLNTFPQELIEGNTWNDTFWGVCDGKGENQLGVMLMEVRSHLRFQMEQSK